MNNPQNKPRYMMTKEERCPIPGEAELKYLHPKDAAAVRELFQTYSITPPLEHIDERGKHKRTKLCENDVQVIRFLEACRIPRSVIADLLDISIPTVKQIVTMQTWRHLPYYRPEIIGELADKVEPANAPHDPFASD